MFVNVKIKISNYDLKVLSYGYITLDGVEPAKPIPEEGEDYDKIKLINQ